jgi:hypothetical protein
VQSVVAELNGEKIDVIPWAEDPGVFVANALSPAQVVSVDIDQENRIATVTVPERMLSLAIGREGQNARLAAKLTGWRIDIRSDQAAPREAAPSKPAQPAGEAVPGAVEQAEEAAATPEAAEPTEAGATPETPEPVEASAEPAEPAVAVPADEPAEGAPDIPVEEPAASPAGEAAAAPVKKATRTRSRAKAAEVEPQAAPEVPADEPAEGAADIPADAADVPADAPPKRTRRKTVQEVAS